MHRETERASDRLAGDVTFRRSEPARNEHDVRSIARIRNLFLKLGDAIADDQPAPHVDAEVVEFFCEKERVGVGSVRRQELAADSNDLSGFENAHSTSK